MSDEDRPKFALSCPMPQFDFEIITLAHGSGGLLMSKLLETGVFDLLSNEELDKHHDGAILHLKGPTAFSTDSFVISPVFFPGGNIGELAVNGTVNDVAMCGGIPEKISLGIILEEGLPIKEFWDILVGIKYAAEKSGVQVVTGDTKVVEKGKGDKIFINTTGLGPVHPKAQIDLHRVKIGDKIIASDAIATHGVAILSVREGLSFETTIESDSRNLNHVVKALLDEFGEDVHLLRDPTRGGVAATLNEIARDSKLEVLLTDAAIPVHQEVSAACEILGLDPLYVANEGVFLAIVDGPSAENMIKKLKEFPECSKASIIGEVTGEHPGKVFITNPMGGRRVVAMPIGEQLPRIC
jgi:hydrogenase expression/formation protein HypE